MAHNKGFGLDFDGFLDLAEEINKISSEETLIEVAKQTIELTKDYVNNEVEKAINSSKYSFTKGENYSQGDARASLEEVKQMPVEVNGTEVIGYAGFDLEKAPEVLPLAYGTPHLAKDKNLYNAIKVKGKVGKKVEEIQKTAFSNALENLIMLKNM